MITNQSIDNNKSINFDILYKRLRRFCNDDDIIWGAIGAVWLRCDMENYTTAQTIEYMYSVCIGEIKNEWKRRRHKTTFSELNKINEDGFEQSIEDLVEYQHFQTCSGDIDLIRKAIEGVPKEMVLPIVMIMNQLLTQPVKNLGITENSCAITFSRLNYQPVGMSMRECARYVVKRLKLVFQPEPT